MKNVIISIKGMQNVNDPDTDSMEFVTDGEYFYSSMGISFSYQESALTGMEGTRTSFMIEDDLITLRREGTFAMQMAFQEGKKHYFAYETPFGAMTMGVDTHSITCTLDEHGGDLEIRYLISMENSVVSRNIFRINIKEA